jgi:hypothetical protein
MLVELQCLDIGGRLVSEYREVGEYITEEEKQELDFNIRSYWFTPKVLINSPFYFGLFKLNTWIYFGGGNDEF